MTASGEKSFIPRQFEFALPLEPHPYGPAKAKQLLAEAGYPHGFDARDLNPAPPFFTEGEAIPQAYRRRVGTAWLAAGVQLKENHRCRDRKVQRKVAEELQE